MSKKKSKTYDIDSFEKLCNVANSENCTRLAIDLAQWVVWYANSIQRVRDSHPTETEGLTNWEIANAGFTWIDDGKQDMKSVTVKDPKTGEITTKRMKQ